MLEHLCVWAAESVETGGYCVYMAVFEAQSEAGVLQTAGVRIRYYCKSMQLRQITSVWVSDVGFRMCCRGSIMLVWCFRVSSLVEHDGVLVLGEIAGRT